jgi:Helix-turn-helix domain
MKPLARASERLRQSPPPGFPGLPGRRRKDGAPPQQGRAPARRSVTPRPTSGNPPTDPDGPQNGPVIPTAFAALQPRLLSARHAAAYLGVAQTTMRALVASGRLRRVSIDLGVTPHRKGGLLRRLLIDVRDLDALLERSKEAGDRA